MAGVHLILMTVIWATTLASATADASNNDWWRLNKELRLTLLNGYDRNVIPQRTQNGSVRVYVNTELRGLWLDEATQVLHINLWFIMRWRDQRLHWDPKDYGGLTSLHVGEQEIWKPDITVYNNADITEVDHYGNTHIIVTQGRVLWVPPAHVRVECPMDLTYWPYDTQTCHVYFGSWSTHGWQIEFNYANFSTEIYKCPSPPPCQLKGGWRTAEGGQLHSAIHQVHIQMYLGTQQKQEQICFTGHCFIIELEIGGFYNLKRSHKWQLLGGHLHRHDYYYSCCPEPYITMHLELNLTRVSPSFTPTVVVPACVVSLVTLIQFVLPLTHPQRITVGCTALLLTLMELLYLAMTLPPLASSLPIIVKFYGQTLVVVAVSVGVCAGLFRLTNSHVSTPPPAILKTVLTGPLATILFLRGYTEKVGHSGGGAEDGEVLEESRTPSYAHEWLLVAAAADRIAIVAFIATFVITLIAYVAVV